MQDSLLEATGYGFGNMRLFVSLFMEASSWGENELRNLKYKLFSIRPLSRS